MGVCSAVLQYPAHNVLVSIWLEGVRFKKPYTAHPKTLKPQTLNLKTLNPKKKLHPQKSPKTLNRKYWPLPAEHLATGSKQRPKAFQGLVFRIQGMVFKAKTSENEATAASTANLSIGYTKPHK